MNNKLKSDFQRLTQVSIIATCIALIGLQFSLKTSQAQIGACWENEPPPWDETNPQSKAYPKGTTWSVVIFDRSDTQATSNEEVAAVSASIQDWNTVKVAGCSNVTWNNATRANRGWNGESVDVPPTFTVYVVRTTDRSGQFKGIFNSTGARSAWVYMHSDYTLQTTDVHHRVDNLVKHEVAHGYGLKDGSIGAPPAVIGEDSIVNGNYVISDCDIKAHKNVYCPAISPTPTPTPGYCNGPVDFITFPTQGCTIGLTNYNGNGICQRSEAFQTNCSEFSTYLEESCTCEGGCAPGGSCSPIVVDVLGDGFSLTNASNGVNFNLDNNGVSERIGWTSSGTDDAWLALDRNNDGVIDSGRELFGDVSPQDPPAAGEDRNGFRALALYDGLGWGGNGDGKITRHDAIFERLRLWQDTNHNGISETCELFGLRELGLRSIDLDYVESHRVDAHGNQFKYRSRVRDVNNEQLGRWAWDVFLVVQQP